MASIQRTSAEVVQIIENFLDGRGSAWDWDDFTSLQIADPHLDAIRAKCAETSVTHPPTQKGHWCNQAGLDVMRELAAKLRTQK
jgi:hypothetical protein